MLTQLLAVWVDGPLTDGVPLTTAVQVDWPRGTDSTIELTLIDSNSQLVDLDLAGLDRLEMSFRSLLGGDVILSKLATKLTALGQYSFAITKADTINFAGRLVMDVWATRNSAQRQVVGPSYFDVTPRVRS